MPEHEIHEFVDWVLLGRTFPRIHDRIDEPIKFLGFRHRDWFHDYFSACLIAKQEYPFYPNVEIVGYVHIMTDDACTRRPQFLRALRIWRLIDLEKMKHDLETRELLLRLLLKELGLEAFYKFFSDMM